MAVCLSGKMPFTLVIPGKFLQMPLGAVGHRSRGTRDSPFCRRLGRDEKCRNGMEWLLGAFIHYIRRTLAFQLLLGGTPLRRWVWPVCCLLQSNFTNALANLSLAEMTKTDLG